MANPRKFSEKIALHTHRQAQETERFEQIMREVSEATARRQSQVNSDKGSSKNTLRINHQVLGAFRGGSLPNVSAQNVKNAPLNKDNAKPEEITHSHTNVSRERESRARSQPGPIRRPQDRKHETSPYQVGPFLSPPSDTSWLRTKSDSDIHQTVHMQEISNKRNDNTNNRWKQTLNGSEQHDNRRPKSSCEMPRVPGINIYYTATDPGTIQIPIGNNTGSLPDLTNVHFPPMIQPIDPDPDQGSSPCSPSPVNTSPSTLSPTSVPPGVRPQGRFQFNTSVSSQQNHLSVPVNSNFLHHNKGVTLENNTMQDGYDGFSHLGGMSGMFHQQQQPPPTSPSPTLQQGYRSPRPSPQSSPSLGGRHSAPCSPGAPSPLSPLQNDYQLSSQHQTILQHNFEQISMDWAQLVASLVESGCTWSAQVQVDTPPDTYLDQTGGVHLMQTQQQTFPDVTSELAGDGGYFSTSPSHQIYQNPASIHTTPNTPTSIPDIILTDFSGDDIARSDLTIAKQLEILAHEGLEPLDFDGLQMLSDSAINIIPDGVEDQLRLDRL